ncbi:hypothetical protein VNI00_000262 [Paramarasmius palmivorus]|uniref:Ankyrin repeat protein n=1 Tax=Paramarasmius palmivorus TaxID=297713 RepID=A0AAW0EC74_9AGAR
MSQQTPEARAFIDRLQALPKDPGVSLDAVLQPSLDDEAELRKLFATDKDNARLKDIHVGLVDVFDAPPALRTVHARVVKDEKDLTAKYVMPLTEENRKKDGELAIVEDLEGFKKNWGVFTEGSLSQLLDWNNVVAAGGSVLACLMPLHESAKVSKRAMRKFYHSAAYPTSDVDLFLWGMTPQEAEVKITKIYEAVRDSVPWEVTSQYPYRSVQIVLRLYKSPAEILAGFDIDSACCAYDGSRVWANPRAITAMMRQCNTVDMTRRSPSYEVRLAKYSSRAFEVYVPTLSREDVDPTIFERSIVRVEGLARLLAFEKLKDTDSRNQFLEARRKLRGRPNALDHYNRRKKAYKGDLKGDTSIGGLEMNDYDVVSLHIPYGPRWNARRIEKLVYSTDLGMNSPFNPKNKGRRLHRHPAFFGTGPECLEDCCECCPDPIDEDENKLQKKEDEQCIRGRISFIEEDPGRQSMSGSFNPIDVGEWSEHVYIGPTEKFFAAIVADDRASVAKMIEEGIDVTKRDHVGRMPLHVAIMAKRGEVACHLIDNGARITSRLVDGRTALHLAARQDMVDVVKKLLEKSKVNEELLKKDSDSDGDGDVKMKDAAPERPSSEDDWSSDDNGVISMDEDGTGDGDNEEEDVDEDKSVDGDSDDDEEEEDEDDDDEEGGPKTEEPLQTPDESGALPEDKNDEPDVFDINAPDWDLTFTPLAYAIFFASVSVVEVLIDAGADVTLETRAKYRHAPVLFPLTLTTYRADDEETSKVAERLISAGASSFTLDCDTRTTFLQTIDAGSTNLLLTLLRADPDVWIAIRFPAIVHDRYSIGSRWQARFPLVATIQHGQYAMLAALLAYGANVVFKEKYVSLAREWHNRQTDNSLDWVVTVLEAAFACYDDVFQLLVPLHATINAPIKASKGRYDESVDKMTLLDWARYGIRHINRELKKIDEETDNIGPLQEVQTQPGLKGYYAKYLNDNGDSPRIYTDQEIEERKEEREERRLKWSQLKTYFSDIERLLVSREAKTYAELFPLEKSDKNRDDFDDEKSEPVGNDESAKEESEKQPTRYRYITEAQYGTGNLVPSHLSEAYDELFEACMKGDNATVQRLCLPAEETQTNQTPLQITVQLSHPTNGSNTGITPLAMAIHHRHWNTARLVFTISAAQYEPKENDHKFTINLEGFHKDEDSDDRSVNSDDSSDTVNKAPINFVDVANRPSKVSCHVAPSKMLRDLRCYWHENVLSRSANNLLEAAIGDDNTDAFSNIFGLYKLSEPPIELKRSDLDSMLEIILSRSEPKMLDEFIRKTGYGIKVRVPGKEGAKDEDITYATNDKNHVYLGLNVHGKKRKDLVKQNDPNANDDEDDGIPLVWKAAEKSAESILDYLSGNGPYEAYKYYAMCNNNEHAIALRRTANLETVLPKWLGWDINVLGESPLTAAVLGGRLSTVKHLFAKHPRLMSLALKETIKFTGYNILMVAVDTGCSKQMVDYLLANGQSAVENDSVRGWNIYHILASGDAKLFEHFLEKLPQEVSESLLLQQSKRDLETPLHLAVNRGRNDIVKLIVNFTKSGLLIRNVIGSMPLHIAVLNGYAKVSKILLDASSTEALHAENGVGDTPLEIATVQMLLRRVTEYSSVCPELGRSKVNWDRMPRRLDVERLEQATSELREMIRVLQEDGKLTQGSKLNEELSAFARYLETQLANARVEDAAKKKREKAKKERKEKEEQERQEHWAVPGLMDEEDHERSTSYDCQTRGGTFNYVLNAVMARPGDRSLVHLVDVQKSASGDLDKVQRTTTKADYDDEGFAPEEDPESKLRSNSMLFRRIRVKA